MRRLHLGGTPPPDPGVYRGVAFDVYASWDAANASLLHGFARTPAHVRHELDKGGHSPTPALDLGWLTHLAILEPARFEGEVAVAPKVDRRTKAGKATWAQWQAEHEGRHVATADHHRSALAMREAVLAHETAAEFFRGPGASEVSIVWEDPGTRLPCKARMDRIGRIGEWPIVGDLKTATSGGRRAFERAAFDFGYAAQAAHYLAGLQEVVPVPEGNPFRRFVHFVVESVEPHLVACYELDESALAYGDDERRRHLKTLAECIHTGEWPGYPPGVEMASLPAWAFKVWTEAA